jgi:hypothetical protein
MRSANRSNLLQDCFRSISVFLRVFPAASPVRVVPQRASFVRHSTKKSKKPLADSPRQG